MTFQRGQTVRICDPSSEYARSNGKVLSVDANSGKVRVELAHFRCRVDRISFAPHLLELVVNGPTERERSEMCGADRVRNSDLGM